MKTTSNKDMLNAIRNQASAEYQEKIPAVTSDIQARDVLQTLDAYPTAKNEFLKTLTDKVVKTEFFSKVYSNPLKMLKKGMLPYGSSIEELFVAHANAKGFFANTDDNTSGKHIGETDATALLGRKPADVKALYISKNFAQVFEVSISDAQLKSAFFSQNGLSELVNQLVGSLTSGAELKEYKDMIALLKAAASGTVLETDLTTRDQKGLLKTADPTLSTNGYLNSTKGFKPMKVVTVKKSAVAHTDNSYSANLAIQLRAYAQKLKFMSNENNMAGVTTFSNIDDLVFLTTPEVQAIMDVELLSAAFNISKAEATYRTIVVDELPTKFASTLSTDGRTQPTKFWDKTGKKDQSKGDVQCLGMLIDRNFLQVIDTVNESRQFDNGRALMTNVFLHKQGIMANCYFANAIAFIADETL